MASHSYGLTADATTLSPLPHYLHKGLIIISTCAFVSFICSTTLCAYLTYCFVSWILGRRNRRSTHQTNQFLVLIYNLLLADIQQSIAFLLNVSAIVHNAINIDMPTCWAQGWFVSTGDLASSVFIFGIAVHTYLSVIKNYKIPQLWFYVYIVSSWVFVYAMPVIAVGMHPHDIFVRAGAWCWINSKYDHLRLWLHYLWMFIAMFGTVAIYAYIITTLQLRIHFNNRASNQQVQFTTNKSGRKIFSHPQNTDSQSHPLTDLNREIAKRATGYLILYPLVYVICTIPLAAGRVAAMAGTPVSDYYFCVAGAMIASNGWLDVILYGFTRGSIVFGHRNAEGRKMDPSRLESFMWYYGSQPAWRDGCVGDWGTVTVIEGGGGLNSEAEIGDEGNMKMDGSRASNDREPPDSPLTLTRKARANALSHLTRKTSTRTLLSSKPKKIRRGTTSSTEDLYNMSLRRGDSGSPLGVGMDSIGSEMFGGGIKAETTVDVRIGERTGGGYELRDVGGLGSSSGGEDKDKGDTNTDGLGKI